MATSMARHFAITAIQLGRELRPRVAERLRGAAQPGDHRLLSRLAGEREVPREELEREHAERVDVAPPVERLSPDLLRDS